MTPRFKRVMLVVVALAALVAVIWLARPLVDFFSQENRLELWLHRLGPLGPLGVILLNALQVIVAIVPGYAMMVAAGYLYGFVPGAIYSSIGMALGGVIAILLARRYGRPLIVRMVGARRLERWEKMARINALPVWVILMMGPFGDMPYYIAGLTNIAIWKIILIALVLRTPTNVLAAAVGSGLLDWRSPWVIGGMAMLILVSLVAMRYQNEFETWVDDKLLPRVLMWFGKTSEATQSVAAPPENRENDATIH